MWNNFQSNWAPPPTPGNYDHWAALAQQWAANRTAANEPQHNVEPTPPNYSINSRLPPPPPPPPPTNNSSNEPDWTADVLPLTDDVGPEQPWSQQPLPPGITNDNNFHSNAAGQWNSSRNNSTPDLNFNAPPPHYERPPPPSALRHPNFFTPYNQVPPIPHPHNRSHGPPFPPRPNYVDNSYWSNNAPFNQCQGDVDERVLPPQVNDSSLWTDKDVDYRPQIPLPHQIIEAAAQSNFDMLAPPPVPTHLMDSLKRDGSPPKSDAMMSSCDSASANKKRAIPGWLREALDKREKEKFKEAMASIAAEEAKLGVKRDAEGDVVMEDVAEDQQENNEPPKKGKFDEDSDSDQDNDDSIDNEEPDDEPEIIRPTLSELLQDLDEDSQEKELAYSLTRVLTEVLLEITNQEMRSIASRSIHKEEKFNVRKLPARSSKASTPNKLAPVVLGGILDYGSGSDNDDIPDDVKSFTSASSAKIAVVSSDSESGEELDELIRKKKKMFNRQAVERERQILLEKGSIASDNSDNDDVDSRKAVSPSLKSARSDEEKHNQDRYSASPKQNLDGHDNKKSSLSHKHRSRSRSHDRHRHDSRRSRSASREQQHHHHSKRSRRSIHSRSKSSTPKHTKHKSRRERSSSSSIVKRRTSRSSSPRKHSKSSKKRRHKNSKSHRNRSSSSGSQDHSSRKRKDSHVRYSPDSDHKTKKKKRAGRKSSSPSIKASSNKSKRKDNKRRHKSRSKSSSERSSRNDKKSKKSSKH